MSKEVEAIVGVGWNLLFSSFSFAFSCLISLRYLPGPPSSPLAHTYRNLSLRTQPP